MTQRELDVVDVVLRCTPFTRWITNAEFAEMEFYDITLEELSNAALYLEDGGFLFVSRLESATEYRLTEKGMVYWMDRGR